MTSMGAGLLSILNGEIRPGDAARELSRRRRARASQQRERSLIEELALQPAQLVPEYQRLTPEQLLQHFRERDRPAFFKGFESASESTAAVQREMFPDETKHLLNDATEIKETHRWHLLGFPAQEFGSEINWRRDPVSGRIWPLDFHADVALWHNDRSDIRVLWELNRLGHFLTLGRAYALTGDETFAQEIFAQLQSWEEQNPLGRGPNWSCAMEVALRTVNLLATFTLVRHSESLTPDNLVALLGTLGRHGEHIERNREFSYLGTSNHYLSDIAGLLWLGLLLPELSSAASWRDWAFSELLREMDKQVLPDGTDHEGSTGYHRYVTELLLYSFLLCRENGVEIEDAYWNKLRAMLRYISAYLRPDGSAPLIGDSDGGQFLPVVWREANNHCFLLSVAAAAGVDRELKLTGQQLSEEALWIVGAKGVAEYLALPVNARELGSDAFADTGLYILRQGDLYLSLNASTNHQAGRSSHRHNDVLSIEVAACGRRFIVDPGSYMYTGDLHERHLFRSTAYHSTIEVDGLEQNIITEPLPFKIGNNARPQVTTWQVGADEDHIVAEHSGYERLPRGVKQTRAITFQKSKRYWLIKDELTGKGEHSIKASTLR